MGFTALQSWSRGASTSIHYLHQVGSSPELYDAQAVQAVTSYEVGRQWLCRSDKVTEIRKGDRERLRIQAVFSFLPAFLTRNGRAEKQKQLKQELLEAIEPLERGATATPDDQLRIDQLARKLEAVNPTKEPLKSDLINGKWELIYTTTASILQAKKPRFLRSITNYQSINVDTLKVQRMETWPFYNSVTGDLTPLNSKKVAVKLQVFKIIGFIPVKAPDTARGELEITYVDEELRLSRDDKGKLLFILKMFDPTYRNPL